MRKILQELFNRLGINPTITDYLEAITYVLIIGFIALIFLDDCEATLKINFFKYFKKNKI